ncbi:fructosamine kinase family protein [Histomonas meleagridis]|uniref:fructosamine kinase family protein n=1 Tax=Histomonas meleagridis TaxID=135588 RepID=UPI00355AC2A7|nr:fructosamine kinase family protein [Histomonas meleagridis]KAH0800770.1 fructosamine kinase family protein [Histomonas meleagridis]
MKKNIIPLILEKAGIKDEIVSIVSRGGGDVSDSYSIKTKQESYFLKINSLSFESNFQSEFTGLQKITESNAIVCPKPLSVGTYENYSYLLMSNLHNLGRATYKIGKHIAQMHKNSQTNQYGFPILTFCGSTPLDNQMTNEPWSEWFARHRIGAILDQIGTSKVSTRSKDQIVERIIQLLKDHDADSVPCLVHGDLWSGNMGETDGQPCIYDPGCYYGDGEVDLAMTELFGGFGSKFYEEYKKVLPIHEGYQRRKPIYNLFHILNHALMFGGFYVTEAEHEIEKLFK